MKGRDEIKELFQKELGNYEVKVDPNLWNGIQSGISSAAGSASASISTGLKVAITVISAAVITVVSIVVYNTLQNDVESKNQSIILNETTNQQVKQIKTAKTDKINKEDISIASSDSIQNEESSLESKSWEVKTPQSKENAQETIVRENDIKSTDTSNDIKSKTISKVTKNQTHDVITQKSVVEKEEELEEENILPKFTPVIVKQENQYTAFSLQDSNIEEVVWDFGDGKLSTQSNPEHFYDKAGTYIVTVKGRIKNQELEQELEVFVDVEGEILNLPNSFTPNGDGRNDYLFVETKGLKELQVTIMNNKQKVVFQSNRVNFTWDGNMQDGTPAPEGNYVYIIVAKDNEDNTLNNYQKLHLSR